MTIYITALMKVVGIQAQRWNNRGGYRQGRGQEGNRGNWKRNSRRQN